MKTTRALSLLLALALLGLVLLALPAPAARANPGTIRVTTTGGAWPCGDQILWTNPCTLDTALTNAFPGDEVWVAAGTYTPTTAAVDPRLATFQLPLGVAIYGGFAGSEQFLTQRNITVNVTILSGDIGVLGDPTDNAYHVLTGSGTNSTTILDGFTVTGGNANGTSPDDSGGGMYNDGGSPTLANVTFSSNSASQYGGGMSNNNSSSPMLTTVTFVGNTASNNGGGIYNYNSSSPTLSHVTFAGNSAVDGGGIFNHSSSPTLTNVIFVSNNASNSGGGMNNDVSSSPLLTRVTFNLNTASQHGGGIHNDNSSSPTLANVTFYSNTATLQGGGMYSANSSNPTLSSTTFYSNSASLGGGMDNELSSPTITNTTFVSNTVSQYGGGMYTWKSSPTLTNVTFAGNSASVLGGGMDNEQSSTTIRNTILWGNSAPTGSQVYNNVGTPTLSDSVVQGGCPAGSTCTNLITTDPLLGLLGHWGGTTQALPLLPGSSAIDTGNDTTCAPRDQRNIVRPQGPHCDIGAFESRRFTLANTSGDNQSTLVNSAFATPFRVTVSSGHGEPVNGGLVTFAAPLSGASTTPMTSTVTIVTGAVTLTLTANGIGGSYALSANTAGAIAPVTFTLTNTGAVFDSYLPSIHR